MARLEWPLFFQRQAHKIESAGVAVKDYLMCNSF